ncbi:peroxisomal leader peptide-processing protease-like isoform X3 [Aricia agestis]|nr:peroxisomal leader peptide-processing protease-like isoform X2 [Aricia agestis]XP_041984548.1 peroxisomal leader peptide-processing protease-like isoform X3 [Aricia agestis]
MFSHRWVLTHGSILSPLQQAQVISNAKRRPILNDEFYANLPEIYVTCEKRSDGSAYDSVEKLSRERSDGLTDLDHSSYHVRVLTGRIVHAWQCGVLDRCVDAIMFSWTIGHRDGDVRAQTQLGKALLSVFVLVDLESGRASAVPLRPLSELFDMVKPAPARGSEVLVHSTPFGNEVFLNTVTKGCVCGAVGTRPSLLLTDCASSLGSEGGPVYSDAPESSLVGMVVCSVSWWRGEWVGLTLAAPLRTVLAHKLSVPAAAPQRAPQPPRIAAILDLIDACTVLVRCGNAWGAGVYVGGGHVLTCAHVVKDHTSEKVSVYWQGVKETAMVRYSSRDGRAYDVALAYVDPRHYAGIKAAEFSHKPPEKGELVLAAGYPYFSDSSVPQLRPTVTRGHLSNVSPSMLQTTCCVQSGFSGGPIFRLTTDGAAVVGMIVSNARTHSGATHPYVNMAAPAAALLRPLADYMRDRDQSKISQLGNMDEMIQQQWRLLPYRSKI